YFLCSMTPPPLQHTLFPYTTLFRSSRHPSSARRGMLFLILALVLPAQGCHENRGSQQQSPEPHHPAIVSPSNPSSGPRLMDGFEDRKSTRLNSSHVAISYAVFCLKK